MMRYRRFQAMNCDIVLAAQGDPARLPAGFEQAKSFIESSEQRFTRFSDESELTRLNQSAGSWIEVSPDMLAVLDLARRYHALTGGLFNPAILKALERVGYDRSMDEIRGQGALRVRIQEQIGAPDFSALRLAPSRRKVWLPAGVQIDLGGIAKGWIVEQAAQKLSAYASACAVSAGGDMALVGLPEGESAWEVALEDPRKPDENLVVLKVRPGAVATSATTKRSWMQGKYERHHIIDPRTGLPAETDWLSVTVIANSAVVAEVFAKVMLIAGPREISGLRQLESVSAYLSVDAEGRLWGSENIWEYADVRNEYVSK